MAVKLSAPVAVIGMITFGTMCSLLAKLVYSIEAPSRFGQFARFEKPWFQVLAMFLGMSICIVLDLPRRRPTVGDIENQALLSSEQQESRTPTQPSIWIISLPTLLDLFATACGTTGLLYTTVSVYQMLRGAMLVWTALMSVLFLKRRLAGLQWLGIALCVCGIAMVGVANIASEGPGVARQNVQLGIGIILLGQVLQAGQVVMEEFLLQDMQMSSVRIVAWEGLFGVAHCLLWVFPILMLLPGRDHGRLEDIYDALYMVAHSWKVAAVVVSDMVLMLGYNVCGMEVTENLSAVHRVVIETLRTLCVWVIDLFIYYVVSNGRLGEKWTMFSFLQLIGFALLIAGTIAYNYEHLISDYRSRTKTNASAVEASPTPIANSVSEAGSLGKMTSEKSETYGAVALPVDGSDDNDHGDDEDDSEEDAGSFLGHAVGSASHSPFMVVGTPHSYTSRSYRAMSNSPRFRRSAVPRSLGN